MREIRTFVLAGSLLTYVAMAVADDHMPNPGGGTDPCFKLVEIGACNRAGINNSNSNVCPTQSSRLIVSNPQCPYPTQVGTGESGRKSYDPIVPNVDCEYQVGYPNPGGGCTWLEPTLTTPVTCYTLAGNSCIGKPPCNTPGCEE